MKCALLLVLAACSASAVEPCYKEPGTRQMTCIDGKHVRSNGDLRASHLFKGGPKGVEQLPYIVIANCKQRIATLQDSQGVNFGAGPFNATKVMEALRQWLCEAKKTQPNKSLVQF